MILDRIAGAARRRVEEKKRIKPLDLVMMEALACAESLKGRGCGKEMCIRDRIWVMPT